MSGVFFLGIGSLDFSEFWHGARNSYEVVLGSQIFLEKLFLPQELGKMAKNRPKLCVLNLKKN